MFKAVLTFGAVLLLVAVRAKPMNTTLQYEVIELEEPCVRQGGICVRIEDCDPSQLVQLRGVLCPIQRHLGVECCYI